MVALLAAGVLLAAVIESSIRSVRLPASLDRVPSATPIVTDMRGRAIAVLPTFLARESYPARLGEMGHWLPAMTIGLEDARYWGHRGVDFRAMAGAFLRNLRRGRVISGASTITQQLIKLSTGRTEKSLSGKIHEALALKPFVYLAAIDQRKLTAASLLPDTPDAISAEYRDYDPQNYSKRYLGPVRLREALGSSLNVPAVFALSQIGARGTFGYLRNWGLNFPGSFDKYGAGFVLGNAPVRLLKLAGAYAGLARGGEAWVPKLAPNDPMESRRLASKEACTIIADILCDNRAWLAGFGASSPLNLPERTAVKTGTSSGFRDGWCVGFNRDHTVAVWAGNLDRRPMNEAFAVRSAAPLWAAVMRSLYAAGDRPWPQVEEGAVLHPVEIAAETGLLPRSGEPIVREWFLKGTEPLECASTLYVNGVLQLPTEYLARCAGPQNRLGATVRAMPLRILFPKNNATFCYNAAMSKSQQMLPLQSSWPECQWFLNGRRLEQTLIPLERGTWTITAKAGGQTAVANYVVE